MVVKAGSKLGASHQLWQTNEVNKLIWPSPNGIGMVDTAAWDRTVKVAESTKNADGDTVLTGRAGRAWPTPTTTPRRRWPSSRRWAWTRPARRSNRSPSRSTPAAADLGLVRTHRRRYIGFRERYSDGSGCKPDSEAGAMVNKAVPWLALATALGSLACAGILIAMAVEGTTIRRLPARPAPAVPCWWPRWWP